MPLTREFKETVQARLQTDWKYRKELLREGVEPLLAGDLDPGKAILRDYINATVGIRTPTEGRRAPCRVVAESRQLVETRTSLPRAYPRSR